MYLDKKIAELNKIIENKGKLISFYEEEKQAIINQAKWAAAMAFCKQKGITFRVINEHDMYHGTPVKRRKR